MARASQTLALLTPSWEEGAPQISYIRHVQLISVLTWPCSGEASQSRTDTGRVSVTRACSAATTTTVTVRWPGLCEALGIRTPRRGVAAFSSAHESSDETFLTCSVEVPVMGRCSRPHAVTQLHNSLQQGSDAATQGSVSEVALLH